MEWHEQSKGFWRSKDGRFDIIDNGTHLYAIDWEGGRTATLPDLMTAKAWCLSWTGE